MAGKTAIRGENLIRSETYAQSTQRIQAQAVNLGGATVNQEIMEMLGDYQRKNGVIWQLIKNKKYAKAPIIQEGLKVNFPTVGAVPRDTLDHSAAGVTNPAGSLDRDLTDPGQEIKAISGQVDIPHFAHSMNAQQGYKYEDTFAEDTDDLIHAATRYMERQLIVGDATANPDQFNGFTNLMTSDPNHVQTIDLTGASATQALIHQELNKICIRAMNEPNNKYGVTHIFCSGGGQNQMINEVNNSHVYENQVEIVPNQLVPAIMTPAGKIPIVSTPFLFDDNSDPTGDFLDFWLIDMELIEWQTVVPIGGKKSHNFQIFDYTKYVSSTPLVEKRMVLQYGALYAKNRGRGIYRLRVKTDPGTGIFYS